MGKDRDIEPEVVETLIATEPDAGAGGSDHQRVEESDSDPDVEQVQEYGGNGDRAVEFGQGHDEQCGCQQDLCEHGGVQALQRDEKLGIYGPGECEIESAGADMFAECRAVGHEEGFHDRVDQHAGGHKGKVFIPGPFADLVDFAVDQAKQGYAGSEPEEASNDLDQEVCGKHHFPDQGVADELSEQTQVKHEGGGWVDFS